MYNQRQRYAMETTETLRKKIQFFYDNHVPLHMDVSLTHPKIEVVNAEVIIKDVYPYIFRVETAPRASTPAVDEAAPQCYTLQYADIMTGHIRIAELEMLRRALARRRAQKQAQIS